MGATSKWRKTLSSLKRSSKSSTSDKDKEAKEAKEAKEVKEAKEEKDSEKTPTAQRDKEEVAPPSRNILYRLSTFKSHSSDREEVVSSIKPSTLVTGCVALFP